MFKYCLNIVLCSWIWDDATRAVLERYRNVNGRNGEETERIFNQETQENDEFSMKQNTTDSKTTCIQKAIVMQEAGKEAFRKQLFYAALTQFRQAVTTLSPFIEKNPVLKVEPEDDPECSALHVWRTCACNAAVCALKEKDLSSVEAFANKVLKVTPNWTKALYCKSKALLLQHRYEEARDVLQKYLHIDELQGLCDQIATTEAAMEAQTMVEPLSVQGPKETILSTPLPPPHSPAAQALTQLQVFIDKSKMQLKPIFRQLDKSENGAHLFLCTYYWSGKSYTESYSSTSKRKAQHLAVQACIDRLWEERTESDLLLKEDQETLAAHELEKKTTDETEIKDEFPKIDDLGEIRLTALYAVDTYNPFSELLTLAARYPLKIEDTYVNASIPRTDTHSFICTMVVNGENLGVGTASNKKLAKRAAAEEAIKGLLQRTKGKPWIHKTQQ